ncbi:GM10484 [Drosophila sechellia]|uniref:GM10484 n=1 Tax=Drosophila sechellia TaxID=7238 RepID=B4I4T4_DROSE|nr:GM10484 [Drosophila sechellia]
MPELSSRVTYVDLRNNNLTALSQKSRFYFEKRSQPVLVWFYEHGVCLSLAARRELDKDKRFDAFLAFTHKDEALLEEFVDRLERGEPRFRLCFYLRDWLAGESIPDCTGQSIKDSRRIIVLMTENFMNSTWGRLEFRLALHATSRDRCKRLIVVLYPNVKS